MLNRTTRYPIFIYVGLLIIIGIISAKYWKLSQINYDLRSQIIANDDKLNQNSIEKNSLEKDKEVCLGRVKFFEDRVEQNQMALNKKDDELNDLNQRIRLINENNDRYKKEIQDKLTQCNAEESKLMNLMRSIEFLQNAKISLESQLNAALTKQKQLEQSPNCDASIKTELTSLFSKLYEQITDVDARNKLKAAFNAYRKPDIEFNQKIQNQQNENPFLEQKQEPKNQIPLLDQQQQQQQKNENSFIEQQQQQQLQQPRQQENEIPFKAQQQHPKNENPFIEQQQQQFRPQQNEILFVGQQPQLQPKNENSFLEQQQQQLRPQQHEIPFVGQQQQQAKNDNQFIEQQQVLQEQVPQPDQHQQNDLQFIGQQQQVLQEQLPQPDSKFVVGKPLIDLKNLNQEINDLNLNANNSINNLQNNDTNQHI